MVNRFEKLYVDALKTPKKTVCNLKLAVLKMLFALKQSASMLRAVFLGPNPSQNTKFSQHYATKRALAYLIVCKLQKKLATK